MGWRDTVCAAYQRTAVSTMMHLRVHSRCTTPAQFVVVEPSAEIDEYIQDEEHVNHIFDDEVAPTSVPV